EMDNDDEKKESDGAEKKVDVADIEALKKCLEENKGDNTKCKSLVEAFKSSSRIRPMRLRTGSWTDV
ncbi:hypothetical protein A4A49_00154, partial [Nicotiana attenuata]